MALLIDADIIAYKACSVSETEVEFEPDQFQIYNDLKEAESNFVSLVHGLQQAAMVDDFYLCFSDQSGKNFRKELNPAYKANRTGRKPVGYKPFIAKLFAKYGNIAVSLPNVEADDILGLLATRDKHHVIWSEDKDLNQIPGKHLGPDGLYDVDQNTADFTFFKQVLTGDQVDNYKGCPGVGPVTADKILRQQELDPEHGFWPWVVKAFLDRELTEADALMNARMARILRHGDYDHTNKSVKLWTPTRS